MSLRDPVFRKYVGAQYVSQVGTASQAFAIGQIALSGYGLWALMMAILCRDLPHVVFAIWGGWIADRRPRRTILLWTLSLLMLLSLTLSGLQFTGSLSLVALLVLLVLSSAVGGIYYPAEAALVQDIVPASVLPNAQLINSVVIGGGMVAGGALGIVLATPDLRGWLFAINAGSYLLPLVFLLRTPVGNNLPQAQDAPAPYRDAWQSLVSRHEAWWALIVQCIALFFFMNGAVLQPLIGNMLLGGAQAYALISAANGIGYLLITAVQAMGKSQRRSVMSMLGWSIEFGVSLVLYGAAFGLFPSIGFMLVSCIGSNYVNTSARTLLVLKEDGQLVESHLLGRLNALSQAATMGCVALGNVLAAVVADFWGVRAASVGIEVVGVGAICITMWLYRSRSS